MQAVDLVDPGFIVVAAFGRRHSSVWVTSASARHFRRIGPQIPDDVAIDSVYFLNRQVGWVLTFNPSTVRERLYRTRDGGAHWRSFRALAHAPDDPSTTDWIDFLTPETGWLTLHDDLAAANVLYVTHDGGISWRLVHIAHADKRLKVGELPQAGRPVFATRKLGFVGGAPNEDAYGPACRRATAATPGDLFSPPAAVTREPGQSLSPTVEQ